MQRHSNIGSYYQWMKQDIYIIITSSTVMSRTQSNKPGKDMDIRTASRTGRSGLKVGLQYSEHMRFKLVTTTHNSQPNLSRTWKKCKLNSCFYFTILHQFNCFQSAISRKQSVFIPTSKPRKAKIRDMIAKFRKNLLDRKQRHTMQFLVIKELYHNKTHQESYLWHTRQNSYIKTSLRTKWYLEPLITCHVSTKFVKYNSNLWKKYAFQNGQSYYTGYRLQNCKACAHKLHTLTLSGYILQLVQITSILKQFNKKPSYHYVFTTQAPKWPKHSRYLSEGYIGISCFPCNVFTIDSMKPACWMHSVHVANTW